MQLEHILGTNVKRMRYEQDLSKVTFAKMTGISRPYLDSIEKGAANVRLSYLERLADALCVPPTTLITPQGEGYSDSWPSERTRPRR